MKSPNKIAENEKAAVLGGDAPVDPFAFDFFGVRSAPTAEYSVVTEGKIIENSPKKRRSSWFKSLPRLTNREAEFSGVLQNLPDGLTDEAARISGESIARYTFKKTNSVECSVISVAEVNLNDALKQIGKSPQLFLTLGCQAENAPAMIALGTDFASSVIDLILGGQTGEIDAARRLSPIEMTIVEFLALNILSDINEWLGQPVLCLQTIKSSTENAFQDFERGAEIVINLELDDFSGIVSLFAAAGFLRTLDRLQNPALIKRADRKKLRLVARYADSFNTRLQLGTTSLDADSLLFLEPDDVILIEQPSGNWENGSFDGNLRVTIGSGKNYRLNGVVQAGSDGYLTYEITEIISEETRGGFTPAKFKMNEIESELSEDPQTGGANEPDINGEADADREEEQLSASLENVQVGLRVELAGNRMSLRELQNLRSGQIIALGCRPTDAVRVVADNNEQPLAMGELVEIEGQLGVRLTKVFI